MSDLKLLVGQHSRAGRKALNQDFHGASVPEGPLLHTKGVAVALADGIGSSAVSQVASAAAVRGFLDDYYDTSEAWSVRRSGQRVLEATNSWLHAQNQRSDARFDRDRGHVCTFSALVFKGREAHLLHVGDTRVYRVHPQALEQLSEDHRVRVSSTETYLGRALGAGPAVEIDYRCWDTEPGEVYLLATDGVWEHLDAAAVQVALAELRAPLFEEKVVDHVLGQVKLVEEPVSKETLFADEDDAEAAKADKAEAAPAGESNPA